LHLKLLRLLKNRMSHKKSEARAINEETAEEKPTRENVVSQRNESKKEYKKKKEPIIYKNE
jgi:hypothetical protein